MLNMKKIKKKCKQGSGEALEFCFCLPLLLFVLIFFVSILQIGMARERLEYATYVAARSAVVCTANDDPLATATDTAKNVLEVGGYQNVRVKMNVIKKDEDGTTHTYPVNSNPGNQQWKTYWQKGSYLSCEVQLKLKTVGGSFGSGIKKDAIYMMIERPGENVSIDGNNQLGG